MAHYEKCMWIKNLAGRVVLVDEATANKMIKSGQAVAAQAPKADAPAPAKKEK